MKRKYFQEHPKCEFEGCSLPVWRNGKQCALHMPRFHQWSNEQYHKIVLEFINEHAAGNNGIPGEYQSLLITNIDFNQELAEAIITSLDRPIRFERCNFPDPSVMLYGVEYRQYVAFINCTFGGEVPRRLLFMNCSFGNSVKIESEAGVIEFYECLFKKSVVGVTGEKRYNNEKILRLTGCSFQNETDICSCHSNADITMFYGSISSTLEIRTNQHVSSRIKLENVRVNAHATVALATDTRLIVLDCSISKDFMIRGWISSSKLGADKQNMPVPTPQIAITGLRQFAEARVRFKDMDIGRYDSVESDYTFFGVVFDNVLFPRLRGGYRRVLSLENELRGKSRSPTLDLVGRLSASYMNLKIYFDNLGDYKMGNDFHVGEMWARWQREILRLRQQQQTWSPFVIWYFLYSAISEFGQSLWRPFLAILFAFIIAVAVYWIDGVVLTNSFGQRLSQNVCHNLDQALIVGLRGFTLWFRPEGRQLYVPAESWGWFWLFVQQTVTLVGGAFFLLALRRRFKR